MRKRILSVLLVLVMCLSMLPTAALAANDPADVPAGEAASHVHCLCGETHRSVGDHTEEVSTEFIAWTDDLAAQQHGSADYTAENSLPKTAGSYFLTKNVTLSKRINYSYSWKPANGTVLCLNGCSITQTVIITM